MVKTEHDIHTLTDFKRNINEFAKQMKHTKVPVILTVNGKAELVVQDAASYQEMRERLEEIDTIEGIRRGLEQMDRGEGRPAAEVFAKFAKKHKIADG